MTNVGRLTMTLRPGDVVSVGDGEVEVREIYRRDGGFVRVTFSFPRTVPVHRKPKEDGDAGQATERP